MHTLWVGGVSSVLSVQIFCTTFGHLKSFFPYGICICQEECGKCAFHWLSFVWRANRKSSDWP